MHKGQRRAAFASRDLHIRGKPLSKCLDNARPESVLQLEDASRLRLTHTIIRNRKHPIGAVDLVLHDNAAVCAASVGWERMFDGVEDTLGHNEADADRVVCRQASFSRNDFERDRSAATDHRLA